MGQYQKMTDAVIERLAGEKPRLLLHCCCAPCASYVLEYLSQYFTITILFFNPNIRPEAEYQKRWQELEKLLEIFPAQVLSCAYASERFDAVASELWDAPEGGARCSRCFALRLGETARLARAPGFQYFTTTLSISPHKNADLLHEIGTKLEEQYGVSYLPADFKKRGGYQRSIALCKEYGIYRQNYCGCKENGLS